MQWILLMLCLCFAGCLDQFQSSGSESNNNEIDGGIVEPVEGEGEGSFVRPDAGEGEGEGNFPIPDVGIREDDAGEQHPECEEGSSCSAPVFIGCACDAEHVLICTSEISVCRNQECVLTRQNEKVFCEFGCLEGACLTEVNCDDQNPCTIDTATDNTCSYAERAEWDSCGDSAFCLHSQRGIECKEVTCPSDDPCLVGVVDLTTSVPNFPCRYERLDTPECNQSNCQANADCVDGKICYNAHCREPNPCEEDGLVVCRPGDPAWAQVCYLDPISGMHWSSFRCGEGNYCWNRGNGTGQCIPIGFESCESDSDCGFDFFCDNGECRLR